MNLDVSSQASHGHSRESPTLRSSLRQSRREEFQSYRAGEDEIRQTTTPSMKNRLKEALTTYRTYYELRVRNRYLGYMAVSIITLIFLYFIVYVFLVGHLYLEKEKSIGSSFLKLTGRSYADDENMRQIWLLGDQLKSTAKSGIITLPTRVRITKGQKTGECGTPLVPCQTMTDCSPKNFPNLNLKQKCVTLSGTRKGCNAIQWCPAEDIENSAVTKIIDLSGVPQQTIGIKSMVSFSSKPELAFSAAFNTIDVEYPRDNANTFSVDSLLVLAGTNYQNVKYIGCILQVNVYWRCDLDDDECGTYYEVKRLDNEMGFAQKHTEYYKDGLDTTRDEYHYSGIKIIVNVVGVGERVSIPYLVMYFFSTIVLLYVVRILTDLFLVYFATEKRHYSELKFEHVTPDNSY